MRPLHNKRLHSNISFSIGEANFCRINRLIQRSIAKYRDKQILPAGKANNRQSLRNYNFQANRLAQQILIFKFHRLSRFCEGAYCAGVSLWER